MFNTFFFENCAIYEIMWKKKYGRQATDGDTAHALGMVDIQGYRHTLRI